MSPPTTRLKLGMMASQKNRATGIARHPTYGCWAVPALMTENESSSAIVCIQEFTACWLTILNLESSGKSSVQIVWEPAYLSSGLISIYRTGHDVIRTRSRVRRRVAPDTAQDSDRSTRVPAVHGGGCRAGGDRVLHATGVGPDHAGRSRCRRAAGVRQFHEPAEARRGLPHDTFSGRAGRSWWPPVPRRGGRPPRSVIVLAKRLNNRSWHIHGTSAFVRGCPRPMPDGV